jgi:hypothetical protein
MSSVESVMVGLKTFSKWKETRLVHVDNAKLVIHNWQEAGWSFESLTKSETVADHVVLIFSKTTEGGDRPMTPEELRAKKEKERQQKDKEEEDRYHEENRRKCIVQ